MSPIMGKHGRRPPQLLEPLKPVDYIKYPDVIAGAADITRPRDIYSFLSLGYVTTDFQSPLVAQKKQKQSDTVSDGSLLSSTHTDWNQNSSSSYVFFDTFNANTKLPAIKKDGITEEDSDCLEDHQIEQEETFNQQPRKSLINEEDHIIKINQTYIFAPPERLQDAVKYNKNVILPKIKPKKTVNNETPKEQDSSPTTKTKQVRIDPTPVDITPRQEEMNTSNYLFGVRPECFFMNNRLGDRNPFLKNSKESPSLSIPKASPGLQDLKDYDEYPNVYWELRDGTINHPEDLEADMIDRDLYRLRQISTLKLNTVERTFQVSQDPFRRWRWKAGEPVFSPRQQQRPMQLRSLREKKMKEIPIYPQALSKPQLKISIAPIKPTAVDNSQQLSSRGHDNAKDNYDFNQFRIDTPFEEVPALPLGDTPRDSSLGGITPREIVAASMDSFRRMDQELAEDGELGKIPVQKLHELKGKKNKLPVKTSLVKVNLDSVEAYKREFRGGATKPLVKITSKGAGHSHKLESFREQFVNSCDEDSKMNTARSQNDKNSEDESKLNESRNKGDGGSGKRAPAQVSTLLLQPDLSRLSLYPPGDVINSWDVDTGTLSSEAANLRNGMPSPIVSDSSNEKRKNSNITSVKTKRLEVFAEKADAIKIPTGRISFYKNMPSYKLDLVNYPPSNARQSCQRSTSAGISDGRMTNFTNFSQSGLGESRQQNRAKSSGTRDQERNIPPQSSGANTGVSIRFGQQGQVIVSSSREGRKS